MVTVAGVTPAAGEILMPAVVVESEKSVLPPPGSVIVSCWVATLAVAEIAAEYDILDCRPAPGAPASAGRPAGR